MVVHRAQPEEMPNLARGGILLPRVQIVFLEIQVLVSERHCSSWSRFAFSFGISPPGSASVVYWNRRRGLAMSVRNIKQSRHEDSCRTH